MTISRSVDGWIVVGEIDASTAPTLEKAFDDLPDGNGRVVLDLSDVSFIDSSGLRVLIALARRADEEGRPVVLDRPSPAVARLLDITGLVELFGGAGHDETTSR